MHTVSHVITLAQLQWQARGRIEVSRHGGIHFARWGLIGGSFYVSYR